MTLMWQLTPVSPTKDTIFIYIHIGGSCWIKRGLIYFIYWACEFWFYILCNKSDAITNLIRIILSLVCGHLPITVTVATIRIYIWSEFYWIFKNEFIYFNIQIFIENKKKKEKNVNTRYNTICVRYNYTYNL